MAWCCQAASHYLSPYWPDLCYHMMPLDHSCKLTYHIRRYWLITLMESLLKQYANQSKQNIEVSLQHLVHTRDLINRDNFPGQFSPKYSWQTSHTLLSALQAHCDGNISVTGGFHPQRARDVEFHVSVLLAIPCSNEWPLGLFSWFFFISHLDHYCAFYNILLHKTILLLASTWLYTMINPICR